MSKFDFGLMLLLVMMVFMILNALHVTFVPFHSITPSWFVQALESAEAQ